MKVEKLCKCGTTFFVIPAKAERSKFCSKACQYRFYVKATGFKRVDKTPNPNWFQKGHTPFHKGTKGVRQANSGSIRAGERRGEATEFKLGHVYAVPVEKRAKGERHRLWKGENVGYHALHAWVTRERGAPCKCEQCGCAGDRRHIHWANKSHEYRRDPSDWIALCVRCHKKYDRQAVGAAAAKFPEKRQCAA